MEEFRRRQNGLTFFDPTGCTMGKWSGLVSQTSVLGHFCNSCRSVEFFREREMDSVENMQYSQSFNGKTRPCLSTEDATPNLKLDDDIQSTSDIRDSDIRDFRL